MLSILSQEVFKRAQENRIGRMMVQLNISTSDDTFSLTVLATGNSPATAFRGSETKAAWQELIQQKFIRPSNDRVFPGNSGIYEIIDMGQDVVSPQVVAS